MQCHLCGVKFFTLNFVTTPFGGSNSIVSRERQLSYVATICAPSRSSSNALLQANAMNSIAKGAITIFKRLAFKPSSFPQGKLVAATGLNVKCREENKVEENVAPRDYIVYTSKEEEEKELASIERPRTRNRTERRRPGIIAHVGVGAVVVAATV